MTPAAKERVFPLLPALYRVRDADPREARQALRTLLSIIERQFRRLEDDIARLYDNWFIETCDEWVVPYIGDLLGVQGVLEVHGGKFSQRGLVANTLGYRRRKGTAAVLEQLARDVTGWPAKAVEFFQLLATTQYLNHVRPDAVATVDLRDVNRLGLLHGPFERAAHTAEVRNIDRGRGRYNIPHVGLFVWRLQSYAVSRGTPRAVTDPPDGRYGIHSLGYDAPLFTRSQTEGEIAQLADEVNVPGPIRSGAFFFDLQRSQRGAATDHPAASGFYGPGRSLHIVKDGVPLSLADVICKDLRDWDRPPAGVTGLMSGPLDPFPSLTSGTPAVSVTIGDVGPHVATLSAVPVTLAEAANLLQSAVRSAHPGGAFRGVRVVAAGDRLVVLPGRRGAEIAVAAAPADPDTAGELALDGAASQPVLGVLSGDLEPFPALTQAAPTMIAAIGSTTHELLLVSVPGHLSDARAVLEAALQAHVEPAFAGARVLVVGPRLLVLPGAPGDALVFGPTAADPHTVRELGLGNKVAIDVRLGRLAFAIGDTPREAVSVSYNYGFSGDIGGGPYDRRRRRSGEGNGQRSAAPTGGTDTVADPSLLGVLIRLPSSGIVSISDALHQWSLAGSPPAVIQIDDSRTYEEDLAITMPGPAQAEAALVIQAANGQRPTVLGDVVIAGGSGQARLGLNGLLIAGNVSLEGSLGSLSLVHATLVPGRRLSLDRQPVHPDRPSLAVAAPNDRLTVTIDHSITGPLRIPADAVALEIRDSIVDSPARGRPALVVPALASAILTTIALSDPDPSLRVTIGEEGPYRVDLAGVPTTVEQARDRLQDAIRAHAGPAFQHARVVALADDGGHRLVLLPGVDARVTVEAVDADPTAAELGLDRASARQSFALIGGPRAPFPGASGAPPSLVAAMGDESPRTIVLPGTPTTLADASSLLQTALRTVAPDASSAFTAALVGVLEDRLIVLPGREATAVVFGPAPADATTVAELGLESDRPAVAATDAGERPGPPTTLERATVFGSVHVREFALMSETIVTGAATADRRQVGCVRFSASPESSRTPARYRCQPDLAIQKALDAARAATAGLSASEEARIRADVRLRLTPTFTSVRYGDPGYGQLSLSCAEEIRTGAEDENEMGAFHFLQQAQRVAHLRANLDEYLRFGLAAGTLFVT